MPVNGESKQWHERPAIVKSQLEVNLGLCETLPGKGEKMKQEHLDE